jgi:chromatin remodeling complex protein RSC6
MYKNGLEFLDKKYFDRISEGGSMSKGSAINKKLQPSDDLAAFIGSSRPISRGGVMKKLWDYIKENDLQDEYDKRVIHPDEALATLLGKRPLTMFEMTKKISKHLIE